jgi:hypothetical protein
MSPFCDGPDLLGRAAPAHVVLGGKAAGNLFMEAEGYRPMLGPTTTAPGR